MELSIVTQEGAVKHGLQKRCAARRSEGAMVYLSCVREVTRRPAVW